MFGLFVGMITEYATGVDFPNQLKLTVSVLGIAGALRLGGCVCECSADALARDAFLSARRVRLSGGVRDTNALCVSGARE